FIALASLRLASASRLSRGVIFSIAFIMTLWRQEFHLEQREQYGVVRLTERDDHSWNVLHQGVPRLPCISVGRKSSSTGTKTSLISVRLRGPIVHNPLGNPSCRAVHITQAGQEGPSHGSRSKALIAVAAQTASNVQVELGTELARLRDRVAALQKLAHAARRPLRAIKS
ncbi:hypothetical protein F442_08261, partial [Phytophthora nicotianae P10297]